jgi:Uma2 family endonuclease
VAVNRKDLPYHYYSLREYFALEEASDARFEYWDGDIVCMSGGSIIHYRISSNIFYRLRQKLEGGPCMAFTADAAILTPTLPPYRYPDASVVCGKLQTQHVNVLDAIVNPVVIVEVLSPSTRALDEGQKFEAYKPITTFREYLLVEQGEPRVTRHARQPDGSWSREDVAALDSTLTLESVGCSIPLRDIYEGVDFSTESAPPDAPPS